MQEISFKPLSEMTITKDHTILLESKESLCGVEVLLQSNGLKIFLSSLPSRKDLRLFMKIIELSSKNKAQFSDADLVQRFSKVEEFNSIFEELWESTIKEESIEVTRQGRVVDLKDYAKGEGPEQEGEFVKKLNSISQAKDPEVFPVDDKESAIWDGSSIWIDSSVEQVLFSQKYFKGKICGEIDSTKIKEILAEKVCICKNGFILPEARKLSGKDIENLNSELNHYEKKEVIKKLEKLTIEVGQLEEISYSMSRALFEGSSLTKVTDKYVKNGISKAQLEVAALAVSGMLEIAATSRGASLDDMQSKLKTKCKLTNEAAYAVASGFVNAAKEAKPENKKVNWIKLSLLAFFFGTLIWFFFLR